MWASSQEEEPHKRQENQSGGLFFQAFLPLASYLVSFSTPDWYAPSPYLWTDRESEQVHLSNAKARREFFVSSAPGLKPHPTQRNQTRAPNEAVWRFIYSQLFVSVTGYLAIPDWTGRISSCNAFLMLSRIEIFPYLVKECSSRKQETWLRSPALLCTSLSRPPCLTFMCYHFFQTKMLDTNNKLFGPEYFMKGTVWYLFWPGGIGKICWERRSIIYREG